jgi:ABC-type branched-subunit amino acid transport system ATPase component
MSVLLEAENLVKHFGGVVAVNGVTLRLEAGEIRGVIGPNGSGKTTLVNLLSGFYGLDSGRIRFNGTAIETLRPDQRLARGLMRTFQIPKLFDDMTVYENLLVPALSDSQIGRRSSREIHGLAEQALIFSKLSPVRQHLAKEISGGQKMLLQIMRGFMVADLRLYIMDEPFTGINPALKDIIIEAILTMNQEHGTTFLLISHEMPTIRRMCRTISVMHMGALIAEGPMAAVANNPAVIEAYLGGTNVFADD